MYVSIYIYTYVYTHIYSNYIAYPDMMRYVLSTYHIFPEMLPRYLGLAMCRRETFEMGSVAWHRPAAATGRGYSLSVNGGGSWYRS